MCLTLRGRFYSNDLRCRLHYKSGARMEVTEDHAEPNVRSHREGLASRDKDPSCRDVTYRTLSAMLDTPGTLPEKPQWSI